MIEKFSEALDVTYADMFVTDEIFSRTQCEEKLFEIIKIIDDKNLRILLNIAQNLR